MNINNRIVQFCNDHQQKRKTNLLNKILNLKEYSNIYKNATKIVIDSQKSFPPLLKEKNAILILDPIDERFVFSPSAPMYLSLIQIGSICDNKNQLFSLKVLSNISKKLPNAKILLVGQLNKQSNYYSALLEETKRLNLIDQVEIKQPTTNLSELFQKSSYLIFPSKQESFGMVLIEAQACGLTCFSSFAAAPETNLGGVKFLKLYTKPILFLVSFSVNIGTELPPDIYNSQVFTFF